MKSLLVGGGGFIGRHVREKLPSDILDLEYGEDFLDWKKERYDVLVFLAARLDFTRDAFVYNYELYRELDYYMEKFPKTHVIFTSSAFVYGNNLDAKETDELNPENIYGWSKVQGEQFVRKYRNHTILRLSNVYGNYGHSAIDKFLGGAGIIHGDGKQIRDFIPAEYVASAIAKCAKEEIYGTYNISSGIGKTINEIYREFGKDSPSYDPYADYGLQGVVLNPRKWESICGI